MVAAFAAHIDDADEKLLNRTGENLNAEERTSSLVPVNPSSLSPGKKGLS